MKAVPLVQTFGHLEYLLKRPKFKHLREQQSTTSSLCPLNEGSFETVMELIDQIIDGFGRENLQFLHIGADEVFNIAKC